MLLAQEFQFKMERLKYQLKISNLEGEHIYDALNMPIDACAIIISYTGSNTKMKEIMDVLKERAISVIAITSFSENILSANADAILHMATRERLYSKVGHYSTNTSVTHLLDILYSSMFARNFEDNMNHIIRTSKIADVRQATTSTMKE
ncbi:MurR/RpiR family transcriptional regulator [Candidatus Enterococcus ferrettii]|uniref:SIS domain-containing protein n=1 Tax=Candidatus Enterococcus ferrettii TaxID=2815324 RepID=A0ABV0EV48_9ENTE|nr:SIS domain-containing protein [Enterococcus sp. 665A]